MIQQAQAPNIAPEVQQFLHRYHLTELQPSFNVDSSPHLRVQCNHCSHKFNLQTRQITAMMGTKISTPDYTFTFCPSCRHTSKFLVNHIMLRKQILSRAGILLPTYVSSAIQHTDVVEVKYKKGKLTAAIQMTAFELAYGSINDIRQRCAGGNTQPAKIVRREPKVATTTESNDIPIAKFVYDPVKGTTQTAQDAKEYINQLSIGEVADLEGWDDVVLVKLTDGRLMAFTIGRFTDSDITALMEDINRCSIGRFDESLIFNIRDLSDVCMRIPETIENVIPARQETPQKKTAVILSKRKRTYDTTDIERT